MADVDCARCGRTRPGLETEPLPGPEGRLVLEGTCRACWEEWLREQVKLMNELRLSPIDPEHYRRLVQAMLAWLRLAPGA